jgi:Glycosyltransferase family 87
MDDSTSRSSASFIQWQEKFWTIASIAAWSVTLLVLVAKGLILSNRLTNVDRYLEAGRHWIEGLPLYIYTPNKGFVYGPFSAVCYAAASDLPDAISGALWCLISAGLFLAGMLAMMTMGPFSHIPVHLRGLVLLLVLPLALGNLDSAQANAFLIGLIMIAVAAACVERWTIAAIAIALATHWKVYPLVVGLLLVVIAPGKFAWRLLLAVLLMGLIPFLFQEAAYVVSQYRLWYDTRTADDRLLYPIKIAPWDLWFVLVRVAGIPLSGTAYRFIQAAVGLAIAAFCLYGTWNRWSKERLFGGMFSLVCAWMTLLGPASELHTYLLLGPAVAFGLVEAISSRSDAVSRALIVTAYLLLLLAILRVAFVPRYADLYILSLQPVGAAFFFLYAVKRYLREKAWKTKLATA